MASSATRETTFGEVEGRVDVQMCKYADMQMEVIDLSIHKQ